MAGDGCSSGAGDGKAGRSFGSKMKSALTVAVGLSLVSWFVYKQQIGDIEEQALDYVARNGVPTALATYEGKTPGKIEKARESVREYGRRFGFTEGEERIWLALTLARADGRDPHPFPGVNGDITVEITDGNLPQFLGIKKEWLDSAGRLREDKVDDLRGRTLDEVSRFRGLRQREKEELRERLKEKEEADPFYIPEFDPERRKLLDGIQMNRHRAYRQRMLKRKPKRVRLR